MTADTSFHAQEEAARAAFLRGIEHRGRVLAEAQCGDAIGARAIVAACKIAFHQQAIEIASTEWASLFWQSMLAQPELRADLAPDPRNPFSQLDPGPRAALLLRLVAELDQVQAADVLGVSSSTYRHALYRALETLRAKGIDESVLHFVRDSLKRDATPTHATIVSAAPEEALPAERPGLLDVARRFRPVLVALAALLLLALTVSYFWIPEFLRGGIAAANGFQTLRAHAPAATLSTTESAISGADFDLIADPQGLRIARDLDLYAWYAATSNIPMTAASATAALPETTLPESAATEADAEDAPEGTSKATDTALPVVTGHPVGASPRSANSKDGDAH